MITAEIPVQRPSTGPAPVLGRRAFVQEVMGIPVAIHVRATETTRPDILTAVDQVFAHLRRVDSVFSTWRADSDLLRLQHHEIDAEQAHPWLSDVVELCLEAEDVTDGLFRAWRPGAGGTRQIFDPTGLVKGWAVVGAGAYLQTVDEIAWSIGAGGDIAVGVGRGMSGAQPVWRIGIEDPTNTQRIADVVALSRGGIATSGAAARGGHVLDPRTGVPVDRAGSATVTGPDLVWADVWATAAWVDTEAARRLMRTRAPEYSLVTL